MKYIHIEYVHVHMYNTYSRVFCRHIESYTEHAYGCVCEMDGKCTVQKWEEFTIETVQYIEKVHCAVWL